MTRDPDDTISSPVDLLAAMGRDFTNSRDIESTLRGGLARITDYLKAEGGALFLLDETGATLTCSCCVGPVNIEGLVLNSDRGIIGRSLQRNKGELVRDVSQDPAFFGGVDLATGFVTRSIICAPMSVRTERIGAIELVNKRGEDFRFSKADLRVLETMAASAGLAILNAHMAQALVEQERVRRELELAAEIQRSLLPAERGQDFPVHGVNRAAGTVSGDFYDFFELDDGRIVFNVGDVSGKGMNAALLMAKTASLYRCLGKTIHSPGRLLARINAEICETAARGMFVTMVGGLYDPATGAITLANAGHEPPLLMNGTGAVAIAEAEVPPLGITTDFATEGMFPETAFRLDGGALYVFTDGVTEGYLADGSVPGSEGVADILGRFADRRGGERLKSVLSLYEHGGRALRDDLTLLSVDDGGPVQQRAEQPRQSLRSSPVTDMDLAHLTVPASPDRLRLVRGLVSTAAMQCGFDEATARDIVLAVDEACQNIIRHAYGCDTRGDIVVTFRREGDSFVVLLRDFARPVDTTKIRPRALDEIRPGGLGTHLIKAVMDEVRFLPTPADGGNLLRMAKRTG